MVIMKIPCEIIVWHLLPSIRRVLIKELVEKHKLTQAQVARRFGVTDATISMYMKSKRGSYKEIEDGRFYEEFMVDVKQAAGRIVGGSDVVVEVCRLCKTFRSSSTFIEIYELHIGKVVPTCFCQKCGI
jgi:predicted transcriptional regulator